MENPTEPVRDRRILNSRADGFLVLVSLVLGAVAVLVFSVAAASGVLAWLATGFVFGIVIWWNANAISHNHLHNPFFQRGGMNRAFALYTSVLTGFSQTIWRERHIWHHQGEPDRRKVRRLGVQGWLEVIAVGCLWIALLLHAPMFFLCGYLPGYGFGLVLCTMQGHYEHATPEGPVVDGISYYGRIYNFLWCNDGYHAEHHRWPGLHWTELPQKMLQELPESAVSPYPPVLRWLPR